MKRYIFKTEYANDSARDVVLKGQNIRQARQRAKDLMAVHVDRYGHDAFDFEIKLNTGKPIN